MSDIFIRDIPEDVLVEIDKSARQAGLSRAEYIRRTLTSLAAQEAARRRPGVTAADLRRLAELCSDLNDPDIATASWQ